MYTSDVNADGRPDILVLGFPGKASWWYENPGAAAREQLWPQHTMLESVDNESPLITDIDGDGVDDLVCSSGGHYGYATHAGQDPRQVWRFVRISPNNGYQRFTHGLGVGDVNNDGHRDLMEKDGWWQNPGSDQIPPPDSQTWWTFHPFAFSSGGAQMETVDMDGDGRNEVLTGLVAHGFGLVYYRALNAAATDFERVDIMTDQIETSPAGLAVSQLHALDVGDINRDGLPDIVTGKRWWAHANKDPGNSQPATLLWLELQRSGDRVRFVPHVIDTSSGVGTQITLGDVNGDGLLDIVAGIKRGAYVFLQRPADLPAGQALAAELAAEDRFGQRPAEEVVARESRRGWLPAVAGRPLNWSFDQQQLVDWEVRGPMSDTLLRAASSAAPANAVADGYHIDTGSDKPALIGEMISRPFRLSHPQLAFRLGGQADPEVRVEVVDESSGQVLASRSPEGEEMHSVKFELSAHVGKLVRLRIVDHSATAFALVDDFRLGP